MSLGNNGTFLIRDFGSPDINFCFYFFCFVYGEIFFLISFLIYGRPCLEEPLIFEMGPISIFEKIFFLDYVFCSFPLVQAHLEDGRDLHSVCHTHWQLMCMALDLGRSGTVQAQS